MITNSATLAACMLILACTSIVLSIAIISVKATKKEIMRITKQKQTAEELAQYYASANSTKNAILRELADIIKDIDSEIDPGSMLVKIRSLRICMDLQSYPMDSSAVYNVCGASIDLAAPIISSWLIHLVDRYYAGRDDHDERVKEFTDILHNHIKEEYARLNSFINDGKTPDNQDIKPDDYLSSFMDLVESCNK